MSHSAYVIPSHFTSSESVSFSHDSIAPSSVDAASAAAPRAAPAVDGSRRGADAGVWREAPRRAESAAATKSDAPTSSGAVARRDARLDGS